MINKFISPQIKKVVVVSNLIECLLADNNKKNKNMIKPKDRYSVYKKYEYKCLMCGEDSLHKLEIDHIIPVSSGGKNCKLNYCVLCNQCNLIKRNHSLIHLIYQKKLKGEPMYNLIMENKDLKRKIFNEEIRQDLQTGFFSATDIVRAGNNWRAQQGLPLFNLAAWFNRKDVKEFMSELEKKYGQIKISGRGRNSSTWVHPLLFIDLALAISPTLKIEVYEWIMDELIRFRNDSGDSYKKMIGCLYERYSNKRDFPDYIKKVALQIKKKCEVADWETATEKQLELRDKIHENIALLADVLNNADEAVRIGILKS